MKQKPALTLVPDEPIDLNKIMRAEILGRDWERCHIDGDRGSAIDLPERKRRWWRA